MAMDARRRIEVINYLLGPQQMEEQRPHPDQHLIGLLIDARVAVEQAPTVDTAASFRSGVPALADSDAEWSVDAAMAERAGECLCSDCRERPATGRDAYGRPECDVCRLQVDEREDDRGPDDYDGGCVDGGGVPS